MSERNEQISKDDVKSVIAKLAAFAEGLPPNEQAALGVVLVSLAAAPPVGDDVEGHSWGIVPFIPGIVTGYLPLSGLIGEGLEAIFGSRDPLRPEWRSSSGARVRDHR